METQVKVDLTDFRLETRKWLEENCPKSMLGVNLQFSIRIKYFF